MPVTYYHIHRLPQGQGTPSKRGGRTPQGTYCVRTPGGDDIEVVLLGTTGEISVFAEHFKCLPTPSGIYVGDKHRVVKGELWTTCEGVNLLNSEHQSIQTQNLLWQEGANNKHIWILNEVKVQKLNYF